jgi:LmbE family N-acetylglucosaminyl deacetylase
MPAQRSEVSAMPRTVLHVSPHPDDESIGAPCTLLALRDADWRVVNVVCSLGREPDWQRRRKEVDAAAAVAEFENVVPERSIRMSSGDDQRRAQRDIVGMLGPMLKEPDVELVIGPHPDDGHHGHETVARAIRDALVAADRPIAWWMWGIWRDLPQPSIYSPCDPHHVELSEKMIAAYPGENARNSYRSMHRARRRVNAVLGTEKVFGFGKGHRNSTKWAELLAEVSYRDGAWTCGPPRWLEEKEPTAEWRVPTDPAGRRLLQSLAGEPVTRHRLWRMFPRRDSAKVQLATP